MTRFENFYTFLALNQASKGFNEAVREVYEPQWDEIDHVKAITHVNKIFPFLLLLGIFFVFQSLDLLWDDYLEKMNDQALTPLNSYCSNFADVKVIAIRHKICSEFLFSGAIFFIIGKN